MDKQGLLCLERDVQTGVAMQIHTVHAYTRVVSDLQHLPKRRANTHPALWNPPCSVSGVKQTHKQNSKVKCYRTFFPPWLPVVLGHATSKNKEVDQRDGQQSKMYGAIAKGWYKAP